MTRRYRDPEAPEVLEAVLERIRKMTRQEWVQELAWRPEGVEETWRMHTSPDTECTAHGASTAIEAALDRPPDPDSAAAAAAPKTIRR